MNKSELTPELQTRIWEEDEWTPLMPPTDLVFDGGEPLKSNRHRIAMNVLIASVHQSFSKRMASIWNPYNWGHGIINYPMEGRFMNCPSFLQKIGFY